MNNIAVSIIIPIYNAEKYLEQCIESAVNQTLKNIEIILINDGSKDKSAEICQTFVEKDSRIKYLYKDNEGLAAARQDGINLAEGEYIGFIDSDDWVELDMYEKMYAVAKQNESDVVLCNSFEYDLKKNKIQIRSGHYNAEEIKEQILMKTIIRIDDRGNRNNIRWSNCLRIYKKETIDRYNICFDRRFRRSQDLAFTFDVMLRAENFYYLEDFLYHNRQDDGSLSRGYTKNMWKLIRPLILHIYESGEIRKDVDLDANLHSTAFFLAIDCILNELKLEAPGLVTKVKNIQQIVNDSVCINSIKELEYQKLNKFYYTVFYKNMKKKNSIMLLINYFYYQGSLKRNIIAPILNILTENWLYKSLRSRMRGKK